MPGTQVAALMPIAPVQRLVRQPSMLGCLFHHLRAAGGDFFPAFLTDHRMDLLRLGLAARRILIAVRNIVNPPELLLAVSPLVSQPVLALVAFEAPDLLPNGGQQIGRA